MTDEKTEGFEPDTRAMRIGAGWVVDELRRTFKADGLKEAMRVARICFPDTEAISDQQLRKVMCETATLRGYSPPGVTYHDEFCGTCVGKGRVKKYATSTILTQCPTCEGDGFSPPMAEMPYRKAGDR